MFMFTWKMAVKLMHMCTFKSWLLSRMTQWLRQWTYLGDTGIQVSSETCMTCWWHQEGHPVTLTPLLETKFYRWIRLSFQTGAHKQADLL